MLKAYLVLIGLSVSLAPLPNAPVKAPERDIKCQEAGHYTGGIGRDWKLVVGDTKDKKWRYSFEELIKFEASGTYDFDGDLVIFTGKAPGQGDIRFGLNYGYLEGKVQFNGFFPESDSTLRFQRKWFRLVDGAWKPAEELTLTMPREAPAQDKWQVTMKGARVTWDRQGKETRTQINEIVSFPLKRGERQKPEEGVPPHVHLIPIMKEQTLEAALPDWGWGRPVGEITGIPQGPPMLRGFHPALAQLPGAK
jgi:hypothetical protein